MTFVYGYQTDVYIQKLIKAFCAYPRFDLDAFLGTFPYQEIFVV